MWGNWSRKPSPADALGVTILGLDLNASRARAIGSRDGRWRTVMLDDPHEEIPLAISLEKRNAELGRAGLNLCRRLPHLACLYPLAYLGTPKEWKAGRHKLDPDQAVTLFLDRLRTTMGSYDTLALTLPSYLTHSQVVRLLALAQGARFAITGVATLPLVLAADHAMELLSEHPEPVSRPTDVDATWSEQEELDSPRWVVPLPSKDREANGPASVLVIDADDHALSASIVSVTTSQARLVATFPLPRLGVKTWKERLLDALSDRCIRLCRRDPRDSAAAEQALYEQLDDALERTRHGQKVDLTIRSEHWFQNLVQQPDDFDGFCVALVRQSIDAVKELIASAGLPEPPRAAWFTAAAGRLPGLVEGLHKNLPERTIVKVLPPEAVAQSTARLAHRWRDGSLPRVFLDTSIPLTPGPTSSSPRSSASPSGLAQEW